MRANVIMVEPDPTNLAAGLGNFKRNGFDGEFIQAAVATGGWQLDSFLQSRGIGRVDILHVDIQGFEVDMITEAKNAMTDMLVDYLFISTHSQEIHHRIITELAKFGYRIEVKSDYDNETTAFDGFVFASSPRSKQIFRDFSHAGRMTIAAIRPDDLIQTVLNIRNSILRN